MPKKQNQFMDKVKIKRARKNKKPVSAKEKLLAGFGVGSALGGLAGGVVQKKIQKTPIVASQSKSQKSALKKAGDLIARYLGAPQAKADFYNDPFSFADPYSLGATGWSTGGGGTGMGNVIGTGGGGYTAPTTGTINTGGDAAMGGVNLNSTYQSAISGQENQVNQVGNSISGNTGITGNNSSSSGFSQAVSGIQIDPNEPSQNAAGSAASSGEGGNEFSDPAGGVSSLSSGGIISSGIDPLGQANQILSSVTSPSEPAPSYNANSAPVNSSSSFDPVSSPSVTGGIFSSSGVPGDYIPGSGQASGIVTGAEDSGNNFSLSSNNNAVNNSILPDLTSTKGIDLAAKNGFFSNLTPSETAAILNQQGVNAQVTNLDDGSQSVNIYGSGGYTSIPGSSMASNSVTVSSSPVIVPSSSIIPTDLSSLSNNLQNSSFNNSNNLISSTNLSSAVEITPPSNYNGVPIDWSSGGLGADGNTYKFDAATGLVSRVETPSSSFGIYNLSGIMPSGGALDASTGNLIQTEDSSQVAGSATGSASGSAGSSVTGGIFSSSGVPGDYIPGSGQASGSSNEISGSQDYSNIKINAGFSGSAPSAPNDILESGITAPEISITPVNSDSLSGLAASASTDANTVNAMQSLKNLGYSVTDNGNNTYSLSYGSGEGSATFSAAELQDQAKQASELSTYSGQLNTANSFAAKYGYTVTGLDGSSVTLKDAEGNQYSMTMDQINQSLNGGNSAGSGSAVSVFDSGFNNGSTDFSKLKSGESVQATVDGQQGQVSKNSDGTFTFTTSESENIYSLSQLNAAASAGTSVGENSSSAASGSIITAGFGSSAPAAPNDINVSGAGSTATASSAGQISDSQNDTGSGNALSEYLNAGSGGIVTLDSYLAASQDQTANSSASSVAAQGSGETASEGQYISVGQSDNSSGETGIIQEAASSSVSDTGPSASSDAASLGDLPKSSNTVQNLTDQNLSSAISASGSGAAEESISSATAEGTEVTAAASQESLDAAKQKFLSQTADETGTIIPLSGSLNTAASGSGETASEGSSLSLGQTDNSSGENSSINYFKGDSGSGVFSVTDPNTGSAQWYYLDANGQPQAADNLGLAIVNRQGAISGQVKTQESSIDASSLSTDSGKKDSADGSGQTSSSSSGSSLTQNLQSQVIKGAGSLGGVVTGSLGKFVKSSSQSGSSVEIVYDDSGSSDGATVLTSYGKKGSGVYTGENGDGTRTFWVTSDGKNFYDTGISANDLSPKTASGSLQIQDGSGSVINLTAIGNNLYKDKQGTVYSSESGDVYKLNLKIDGKGNLTSTGVSDSGGIGTQVASLTSSTGTAATASSIPVANIIGDANGDGWTKRVVLDGKIVNVDNSGEAWDDDGNSVKLTASQFSQIQQSNKENASTLTIHDTVSSTDEIISKTETAAKAAGLVNPFIGIAGFAAGKLNLTEQQQLAAWLKQPGDGILNVVHVDASTGEETTIASITKTQYKEIIIPGQLDLDKSVQIVAVSSAGGVSGVGAQAAGAASSTAKAAENAISSGATKAIGTIGGLFGKGGK